MINVKAPGKLILSGEHAVLYGAPALAMAVNRHTIVSVRKSLLPKVTFDLDDFSYRKVMSLDTLKRFKNKIKRKYERFIHGEYKISDVLQKPVELAQFAFGFFQDALRIKDFPGVSIHVQSDIPIGCGMGSSAATIMCIVTALAKFSNVCVTNERILEIALEIENMQHGKSSGLDLRVSQHGGCLYFRNGMTDVRKIPEIPMFFVNSGMPLSSTGECVVSAARYFKRGALVDDFAEATTMLDEALQENHFKKSQQAILENHRLLHTIGVVPEKVNRFISRIEKMEGAAKICGAGANRGECAGAILILIEDIPAFSAICDEFGYTFATILPESEGVHVI